MFYGLQKGLKTTPDQPFRSKPLTDHMLSHLETKLNGEYGGLGLGLGLGDKTFIRRRNVQLERFLLSVYFLNEKLFKCIWFQMELCTNKGGLLHKCRL